MNASGIDTIEAALGNVANAEHEKTEVKPTHALTHLEAGVAAPQPGDSDFILPTDHDLATLRRVPAAIPWASYLIAFCELAERLSYYGTTVVFQNFIQQPLPPGSTTGAPVDGDGNPGALGRGQQAATATGTFNTFWVYLMPLVGAYMADKYWGRFKTVCVAVGIAIAGHVLLIGSAAPHLIQNDTTAAYGLFWLAIIVMGLGTGAFKSCISPLIAEQVRGERQSVKTLKNGERVIVDPALTAGRLFNYFYLFINIGAVIGQISITFTEKDYGFWLAYLIPTLVFGLCVPVLFFGRNLYYKAPPTGSVLGQCAKLISFCLKGTFSWNPRQWWRNLKADGFWARGKPSNQAGPAPSWMTYDDAWVDEVRRGVKACQVFVLYPFYWIAYNQISNNLISQAVNMKKSGLPNEIVNNLDPISLVILIPLFDLVVYPTLRRLKINFSPIKRITAGFWCAALSMVAAAVTQHYIYQRSPCGTSASECDIDIDGPGSRFIEGETDLNVWIQAVAYVLVGLSEVFASVTGLEYAFTKAPRNMRSVVMALFLVTNAFGAALQNALLPITKDPYLTWQYVTCCLLAAIAGTVFWFLFRNLDKEEEYLNNLATGHVGDRAQQPEGSDSSIAADEKAEVHEGRI